MKTEVLQVKGVDKLVRKSTEIGLQQRLQGEQSSDKLPPPLPPGFSECSVTLKRFSEEKWKDLKPPTSRPLLAAESKVLSAEDENEVPLFFYKHALYKQA